RVSFLPCGPAASIRSPRCATNKTRPLAGCFVSEALKVLGVRGASTCCESENLQGAWELRQQRARSQKPSKVPGIRRTQRAERLRLQRDVSTLLRKRHSTLGRQVLAPCSVKSPSTLMRKPPGPCSASP